MLTQLMRDEHRTQRPSSCKTTRRHTPKTFLNIPSATGKTHQKCQIMVKIKIWPGTEDNAGG